MPVYNEEEALGKVIEEWHRALENAKLPYVFCILNDGSKDDSLRILKEYAARIPQIRLVDKPNSGHGQTCIHGYKLALNEGADWIFQIDSDGQCAPEYFAKLVSQAQQCRAAFGYRKTRDDGFKRWIISRFVALFTWVATGQWIRDPNVPYRLMHKSVLLPIVERVPHDFHLANICVAVMINRQERIKWTPIHFRDRSGGSPSVKTFSFIKHGFTLFRQLRAANR